MYCNKMPKTGMSNRYSSMSGLSDATYNDQKYTFTFPQDLANALEAASRFLNANSNGQVGTYTVANAPQYPAVYQINNKLYAVTQYTDSIPQLARRVFGPGQGLVWTPSALQRGIEFLAVGEIVAKTTSVTPKTPDTDCPPPDNCTEKWVEKTLYVSSKPNKDAIEIPVAFKKLVCEGESTEDPQVDCEELLKALQESVSEGQVPGMVNGLGAVPANLPPDWCKDCEEKLVKASAYVTDYAVKGSKPFKVKVKVLVCETSADPKIDCEEVVKALGAGLRSKKSKTVNGLSEATIDTSKSSDSKSSGKEFDEEEKRLTPEKQVQAAGFPWWMWLVLGGTAVYAARKL